MAPPAALLPPPPARPPSPTELSYTQLAKRAPPFGSGGGGPRRGNGAGIAANDGPQTSSIPLQFPTSALPTAPATAPRTAPPASISVPRIGDPRFGGFGGTAPAVGPRGGYNNYQTPQTAHHAAMPLSAPMHFPPTATTPQHQGMVRGDPITHRATPVEDRVSNLAVKLQSMQQPGPSNPFIPSQQNPRPNRLEEMHQFIDTLKNMQAAVSRTENEQQRVKKSRALHALLTMFENIIDELQTRSLDPSARDTINELEEKVRRLEGENGMMTALCKEREGGMQQMARELQQCQSDMQRLATENEKLKGEVDTAQRQCHEEQRRAQEAEAVASESENVRDGLLSNYARLTEENVNFQREMHETNVEKEKMVAEFEVLRNEISHLESQCEGLTEQLHQKDYAAMELDRKIGELTEQLDASQNLLQIANNDRQRLQDELHASQRNSTTASEQLMRMRDQFSQFRRGTGSRRQSQRPSQGLHDAGIEAKVDGVHAKATTPAQEEEQRRRVIAMAMTRAKGLGAMAREEMGRMPLASAEVVETDATASSHLDPAGPGGEKNPLDRASLNGAANGTASNQLEKSNAAAELNESAPRMPATEVAEKESPSTVSKADEAGSPLEYSASSVGPRSQRSGFDGYSLEEDDSIMNVRIGGNDNASAVSHAESLLLGPGNDLLDYFYNQIKLAE